jgi:hypothetical protein
MIDDTKDTHDAAVPTQNPEGEFSTAPEGTPPRYGRNVSGDEAAEAGDRATADEPVTRDEVRRQSAYQDDSADLGQRAGEAERRPDDEE